MLGSIRKFSTSIYAKILMGIIVIPFVFWGMGSVFTTGNKNIVVVIEKDKYSIKDFSNYINKIAPNNQKFTNQQIDELLSAFIGNILIEKEIEDFGIKLTDNSLSHLIKNQEEFKRENEFSRVEYEKFLIKNNISAVSFEKNFMKNEKKKQFLELIGGGIMPTFFLINSEFNKVNKKVNIQLINLNEVLKEKFIYSEHEMKTYYENNKNKLIEIFKEVKILELTPSSLIGQEEFNNSYFEKLDKIDDLIAKGQNLDSILEKFNLKNSKIINFNKLGQDINYNYIDEFPEDLLKNIFAIDDNELTALIEKNDKYFLLEIIKTDKTIKKFEDKEVKKKITLELENKTKREFISKIVSKINSKNFHKSDFDKLSKNENIKIQKISIKNHNDDKILDKEIIDQIYNYPEKSIIVVHDLGLSKNFLVYIDLIQDVKISKESDKYNKYLNVSKIKITTDIFNTYDNYIKQKYSIDINYKALDSIKNYLN